MLQENRWERTETATLTEGRPGDAVAAAAPKKASLTVVVKDFELSEVLCAHTGLISQPYSKIVRFKASHMQSLVMNETYRPNHSADFKRSEALRGGPFHPLISSLFVKKESN